MQYTTPFQAMLRRDKIGLSYGIAWEGLRYKKERRFLVKNSFVGKIPRLGEETSCGAGKEWIGLLCTRCKSL